MNILFVNSTRTWGGVKTWTLDVAQQLQKSGHAVWIMGRPGPFTEKAGQMGVPTCLSQFGMDFSPLQIMRCALFCRKNRIDRVVVNVGKDMRTAGIAARLLSIPVIHRVGLSGDMCDKWNVRFTQKYIRPNILVPCEQIRNDLPRILPFLSSGDITVIHTGKKVAQSPTQTQAPPLRCVSTSQLNADKGHKEVLIALANLKKKGVEFIYHVVGTGHEETALHTLAAQLGIASDVIWHGFQKDVDSFLSAADIFILPSYKEGLPNSLLEAMAKGLVCLARDVGGVTEAWPKWASGLLLPRRDDGNLLQSRLEDLLTTPIPEIDALKEQFRDHAAQYFNLSTQASLLEQWMRTLRANDHPTTSR
jgi:glycosyltransferase involved in cell wall biosynthesis